MSDRLIFRRHADRGRNRPTRQERIDNKWVAVAATIGIFVGVCLDARCQKRYDSPNQQQEQISPETLRIRDPLFDDYQYRLNTEGYSYKRNFT